MSPHTQGEEKEEDGSHPSLTSEAECRLLLIKPEQTSTAHQHRPDSGEWSSNDRHVLGWAVKQRRWREAQQQHQHRTTSLRAVFLAFVLGRSRDVVARDLGTGPSCSRRVVPVYRIRCSWTLKEVRLWLPRCDLRTLQGTTNLLMEESE